MPMVGRGLQGKTWPLDGSLPDYVQEFVDWLVDAENIPHNMAQWARDHGYNKLTVYSWMRDARVREELEKRYDETNLRPDRIQGVLDAVHAAAKGGDMNAAKLYLQYAEKLKPKTIVIEDNRIEAMSDEELRAALAAEGIEA